MAYDGRTRKGAGCQPGSLSLSPPSLTSPPCKPPSTHPRSIRPLPLKTQNTQVTPDHVQMYSYRPILSPMQ